MAPRLKKRILTLCLIFSTIAPIEATSIIKKSALNHFKAQDSNAISTLKQTSSAFNQVAESATPAVVNISTLKNIQRDYYVANPFFEDFFGSSVFRKNFQQRGLGSGVIVSQEGYILTNCHVVEGVDEIKVTLSDEREFDAVIVGKEPRADIAVLKIEGNHLPIAKLGNSDLIQVGDWAIAVGSPFGLAGTVTVGVISSKNRPESHISDYHLIQTDAAINPGNSGGALLNIEGEVVGINTAIYSKSGGYMGIGFAIPINIAKKIMNDLITKGRVEKAWLGVYVQPITPSLQRTLQLKNRSGALVADVLPNSPATAAGIQRGDVILQIDEHIIRDDVDLKTTMLQLPKEKKIRVRYQRNNQEKSVTVVLSNPKSTPAKVPKGPSFDPLGLKTKTASLEDLKSLHVNNLAGILVLDVEPNSAAAKAGLLPDDLIIELNYKPVKSNAEYQDSLNRTSPNREVLFVVYRDGFTQYFVVQKPH